MSSANEMQVAAPSVEGPVTTGRGITIAGTAFELDPTRLHGDRVLPHRHRDRVRARGADGAVAPAELADYRTRILVYRPADAARFNGTVVVEWLNVSGGLDGARRLDLPAPRDHARG